MNTKAFKSPYAKIARAEEILNNLKLEIQNFNDSKPYILKNKFNKEKNEHQLIYYPKSEIPPDFSLLAGEIIHHLRSALDGAIYDMTEIEIGGELKKTEFPIFEDSSKFSQKGNSGEPVLGSGLYKIRGLRQTSIDTITALQPFNIRKPNQIPTLTLLHAMDIGDKHKRIHTCRRLMDFTEIKLLKDLTFENQSGINMTLNPDLDNESILIHAKAIEQDEAEYFYATINIEIAFDKVTYEEFKKPEEITKVLSVLLSDTKKILQLLIDSLN